MPPCRSRRSRTRPCTCKRWSRPTPTKCVFTATPRSGPTRSEASSSVFASRFETALTKLNDGLARPRAHKRLDQVWQRIGRLKAKHARVASHYQVAVTANEAGDQAGAVTWTRRPQDGSMVTHPGIYCLRSSETDWDEDALWRTYTTLTDVEAVFRSLKSELGLRPIYHRKPARADGHLFITVIAYQLVQVIRTRLRARREHARWTTLRRVLEGQQRVTATFRRPDGRTLHVRTATQAEPDQRAIYDTLGVDPHPGGVRKTLLCQAATRKRALVRTRRGGLSRRSRAPDLPDPGSRSKRLNSRPAIYRARFTVAWSPRALRYAAFAATKPHLRGRYAPADCRPRERSSRTIRLPGVVAAALHRHRTRQLEERLAAGERWIE